MRRILLVEDEFLIRLILTEALSEAGYDVTEAETADQAAALVETLDRFDVLLTDIQTPGRLDGIALGRVIRQRDPSIPIVYMTGRPDVMLGINNLGRRDAFIRKPYGPTEVLDTIERLMAQSRDAGDADAVD